MLLPQCSPYTADILIVDDTLANLQLLTGVLRAEGYNVRPATTSVRALQVISEKPPDLILLDNRMPDMDGYTLCSALKDNPHTREIPILFISASNTIQDKLRAFNVGGIDYMNEPFELDEVKARVQSHLKSKRYQDAMEHKIADDLIEINKLNQEIIDTQCELIFTMSAICETRSYETGQHVKRVAEYTYLLAEICGYAEMDIIKQAASLHDIGKVAIPDSILYKADTLTDNERQIMQTHSQLGYQMLSVSQRPLFKTAAIIALEHHERWNGTGYPQGLHGTNISIEGRMTAIADVFDALGVARSYKSAHSLEQIVGYFKSQRGEHFDPQLTDLFLAHLDEFLVIRNTYAL